MPGRGRGRKDSASDNGTEEQPVVGTFETLRDEGEHFVHVKQFQRAIESFSKALEMKPGDKTCLVTRAKCHLMLGNSAAALNDAEKALTDEEESKGKDIRALCMKAEALYQKGDFEAALVFYHRGNKLRPELQEFRLGIQKCQEAINNSIGAPDSVKLDASGDLSFFYKQDEQKKAQAKGGTYSKPSQQKKEEKKERRKPEDGGSSKTTKQLLGELYCDRTFLEKLYDSLVQQDSDPSDKYIKDQTVDGLEYLSRRADFWRQHKPIYARKRDKRRQEQQWSAKSRGTADDDPMNYILKRLEEIDDAQAKGKYELSLSKAEKTMKKVEGWGEDRVQNKPAVVANLYSCMGNAYLEMESYQDAIDCHTKDLDIGEQHDIEEAKSRALDNLGRTKAKMGQYEDAIIIWEKKLPKSKSKLESTWLYHEIGRCHLELGRNSEAKDYGEKSLAAAKETEDIGWQLHASVLIAQAEVKCNELQAAVDSFERALEIAEKTKDLSAQTAIKKALEEVNGRIVKGVQDGDEKDGAEDNETDSRKGQGQGEGDGNRGKHKGQNKSGEAADQGQFEDADGNKGKPQSKDRDDQGKAKVQIQDKDSHEDQGKHKGQDKDSHEDQGKHKGQDKDGHEEDKTHGPGKDKEEHQDQGKHLGQANNDKEKKADSKKEEKDSHAVSS